MNEKQVIQLESVADQLRDAASLLADITGQQGKSYAFSRYALVAKVVEKTVTALASLQAYERQYSPHSKIVGIDFPTKDGVRFERVYPEETLNER